LYAALLFVCGTLAAQTQKSTFTLIHSDVYEADKAQSLTNTSSRGSYDKFQMIERIIEMGDRHSVPITLLVNPDVADIILSDAAKRSKVREWQRKGHEIGALHRSPTHTRWDGYSNYTQSQYTVSPMRRRVAEFRGTMPQFYAKLDSVAGDSLLLTQAIFSSNMLNLRPSEEEVEWGGRALYVPNGTGSRSTADAFSNPEAARVGTASICRISHTYIETQSVVSGVATESASNTRSVMGAVTHPVDIHADSTIFIAWLQFAARNNPQTIRNIMRRAGCPALATSVQSTREKNAETTPFLQLKIAPNPAQEIIRVEWFVETPSLLRLSVCTVLGQEIMRFSTDIVRGKIVRDIDCSNLPQGAYFLRMQTGETIASKVFQIVR
jgi:hypothetical protein